MRFTSVELLKRLASSGLVSPELGRKWAVTAAKSLTSAQTKDGHAVLQKLLDLRLLTEFQASILQTESAVPLAYGSWVLQAKVPDPVWKDWFIAINREDQKTVWLRPLSQSNLSSSRIRQSVPSLDRAQQNSRLNAQGLQVALAPEAIDGTLVLCVQPVQGTLLANLLTGKPRAADHSLAVIARCAAALQSLHAAGIVHGRVLPDRIYLAANGEQTLARDFLCADTTRWDTEDLGILNPALPKGLCAAHFLAPEFLAAGHQANMASDVYALGCLWWLLLTGRPPANGSSERAILATQAQRLQEPITTSGLPEAQLRCLRHCLAKNPSARFRNAGDLLAALSAATGNSLASQDSVGGRPQVVQQTELCARPTIAETAVPNRPLTTASPSPVSQQSTRDIKPGPTRTVAQSPVSVLSTKPAVRRRTQRRKQANKWMLPMIGGGSALALLLLILFLTGALQPESNPTTKAVSNSSPSLASSIPPAQSPKNVPRDERLDLYQIVNEGDGLWAPPSAPQSLPLDLLPPGGQLFLSMRPARLFDGGTGKQLLAAFDEDLTAAWSLLRKRTGLPPEEIDHCLMAHYPNGSAASQSVIRIKLVKPRPLGELRVLWGQPTEQKGTNHALLSAADGQAFYIYNQPLADSQSVAEFSVGPLELMKEVAEARGAAGPLVTQVQRLWEATDRQSDLCLFVYPNFLFFEGKQLLDVAPPRFTQWLKDVAGNNVRAAVLQTYFEPQWYYEVRAIGATDIDAGRIGNVLNARVVESPTVVESWFVAEQPHPYWRTLAMRYPRMLGTLARYSRTGVENGQAILNGYLPSAAAENLLMAFWLAAQDIATQSGDGAVASTQNTPQGSLTIEQYLDRSINLRFDQEAIEVALQLIADEANSGLPAGMRKLRFELEGDAFEKGGITRNQQIRSINLANRPVRDALTELAKRGNPDPSVTDLREENQKLIWVVMDDSNQPGQQMISLTTRDSASAAQIVLSREFLMVP